MTWYPAQCEECGRTMSTNVLAAHRRTHALPPAPVSVTAPCAQCGDVLPAARLSLIVSPGPLLLCAGCLAATLEGMGQ
jgi:uncharacterized Zn finger protein